jgi:uncharacterized protein (DUF58 family)
MRRYLPFLIILFIIAAVLRIDFFFTIAYLFFLLYLLGRLWMRRSLGRVSFARSFTGRAFSGDEVQVEVKLANTGRLPVPWLQIHESLPIELVSPPFHREVFSLGAGEKRFFRYQLHCRKRGLFWLGPLQAQTGDLLGLEPERSTEFAAEPLVVYPRVVPMAKVKLPTRSPLAALATRTPLFEDPAYVTGVRDYQRGDSPRRIHWTSTASAGRLLVKQYQPTVARETLLALDLSASGYENRFRYDASELSIVAAASLANHIIMRERLAVGLAAEALDPLAGASRRFFLPARSERAHLMTVLEALARMQLAPGPALGEILRRERPRLAWGTTVVAITGRADDGLFDAMAGLRQAGFAVTLVLVQSSLPLAALRARAAVLGVALWPVWREQDLEHRPW